MSDPACAAAAADLTELAARLEGAARALARQSRLPEPDFEGLSGIAFRRHVARSGLVAAAAARDVTLLATALAALGRGLAAADDCRERALGAAPPAAVRLVSRGDRLEAGAQDAWRVALGRFDGAVNGPEEGEPTDRAGPGPLPTTPAAGGRTATPPAPSSSHRRSWPVTEEATDGSG